MTVTWKEIAYKDDCVLIADTDVSGYGFFLDEGDMASDDPTKFPSQQSVKTYVDDNIGGAADISVIEMNILLLAFKIAVAELLTKFNMVDGVSDAFVDESGVDVGASINEAYNETDDYYAPALGPLPSGDLLDEDCSNFTDADSDWEDNDQGIGESSIEDGIIGGVTGEMFKLHGGDNSATRRHFRGGGMPDDYTVEIKIYCADIGMLGVEDDVQLSIRNGIIDFFVRFASNGLFIYDGEANNEVGTDLVVQGAWQRWRFLVTGGNAGTATVDIYLNGVLKASGVDCSYAQAVTDGRIQIGQFARGTANRLSYVDYVQVATGLVSPSKANMTLVSEATEAIVQPDEIRIVIMEEDVDAITINTNFFGDVSRDDGNNWIEVVLEKAVDYASGKQILSGVGNVSGQAADKTIRCRTRSTDNDDYKIHNWGMAWK